MAQIDPEAPPNLLPQNDDDSDNESVVLNEPDNTQQFSRFESEMKDEMSSIARQVQETILGMNEQMQQKFNDLDMQIQSMQIQLRDQNNNQGASQPRNSTPMETGTNKNQECTENASRNQMTNEIVDFNLPRLNSNTEQSASTTTQSRVDNYVKLKPQTYTGHDDFEDFLTQFEITSEINGWDYKAKSLYLANSLTGTARALLNELSAEQRRDYKSLVQKLAERYGSENRTEVFRSQLKSRVKGKGETTAELAQSVRKLTRQAYPKVSLSVIEALALDYFIDAIPETEIRMRLREVGPMTLAEAEKIAVRMEAHRIADKQRTRLVGKVEQDSQDTPSSSPNTVEQQISNISTRIDSLQKSVQNLAQQHTGRTQAANYRNPQQRNNFNHGQNRPYNRNFNQRHFQSRGGNPAQNYQNNLSAQAPRNQFRPQGNMRQSSQGSGPRLN